MGRHARRSAAAVLLGLVLAGCAVGPNYKRPFVPVPERYYAGGWQRARSDQIVNPAGETQTRWTVDAGFSWEVDLWGRIRRLNEAALAAYLATEEGRRGVLLSLVSDVAIAYMDLRELDRELEIAKSTTAAFQGTYDLFNRRLEGGAASALETA